MKRTFLLIYTTVSGTTYKEFKTFQDGPDYDTCIRVLLMNLMNWLIYF